MKPQHGGKPMKRLIALVFLLLMVTSSATAGGVIRPGATLGPRATGMAGAHNAVASDGSAFYHNVAGLTQVENSFVQLGADLVLPRFEFESLDCWKDKEKSEFSLFPMPLIAGATRLSDRLVVGAGLYPPYGLGVTYSDGPYQESLLSSINITLGLGWQLTDTLSVGIGGDIGYGQLVYNSSLHQIGDIVIDPLFMETEADGIGLGYRLGVLWQPTERFSWGLSYSSPMKIKLKGDTDLSLFDFGLGNDDFDASVTFPGRIGTGIAIRPTDKWLLAFDVNWYDHRKTDKIDFNFNLLPTIRQKMEWQNNWSVHLGTEYQVAENWRLRGGVAWMQAAVPKTTTNPIIPDGDGWCASFGVGWQKKNWSVDLAYLYAWADRETERSFNHLAPGDYGAKVDVFSFGVTYRF